MIGELPARPLVTIAYRASAYAEGEVTEAKAFLEQCAEIALEPMNLALMGGVAELLITVEFPEPLFSAGVLSKQVGATIAEVCAGLAEWYARLVRNRPCMPELMAVHVVGRDLRVDLTSDLAPDACLACREIRAIPRLMREIAGVVTTLLQQTPARCIAVGFHADPQASGSHSCVIGRYWEIGQDADEPTMIVDSWRERTYVRLDR